MNNLADQFLSELGNRLAFYRKKKNLSYIELAQLCSVDHSKISKIEKGQVNWLKLDLLLNELWELGEQEYFTNDLLRVFERFPEEDGAGVFWSIIHGVEHFTSYEDQLINSLYRQPSEMGLLMLRRIMNTGRKMINGIEIDRIFIELLSNERTTPALRADIISYLE